MTFIFSQNTSESVPATSLTKETSIGQFNKNEEQLDLCHFLLMGIEEWRRAKKNRNLSLLSRLTKIPYATLKRIEYGQNKPSAETALPIIWAVFPVEKRLLLMRSYFPQIFECLSNLD